VRTVIKRIELQPTNATKKPIDSSARNPLIYIGVTGVPSGLRPVLGGAGRRENTQTESKTCRLLAEMALSAVRKNPQEPAQTRGSRQKKANPEGLVFPLLVVHRCSTEQFSIHTQWGMVGNER
jgi:hypothetical protein